MATAVRTRMLPRAFVVVAVLGTAVLSSVVLLVMQRTSYDTWAGLFIAPALVLASIPAIRRQAAREGDPRVFWLLLAALLLKLSAAFVQLYVNDTLYSGRADSIQYHQAGSALSDRFLLGDFDTGEPLSGTHFLEYLTGLIYMVIQPTSIGGYLVFSWLCFWGLFCFYRAFCVAVPLGRKRSYAHLLFFLPSLLFWGSSIGKEAWMMLALGVAALGSAYVLTGRFRKGLLITGLGLWAAALARPHVAAMLALSLATAFALHVIWARQSRFRPILAVVVLGALILLTTGLVSDTEEFFRRSAIEEGVSSTFSEVERRTSQGGSQFGASVVDSPGRFPTAFTTVLFRPFIIEAENAQGWITALEGSFLIALILIRLRWLVAAVRSIRWQPFVALAVVYIGVFVVAYSSIANFGILARQRVQVLPLLLVLLAIPPIKGRTQGVAAAERADARSETGARDAPNDA